MNELRKRLNHKVEYYGNKMITGLGDIATTEVNKEGILGLVTAAMIGAGGAGDALADDYNAGNSQRKAYDSGLEHKLAEQKKQNLDVYEFRIDKEDKNIDVYHNGKLETELDNYVEEFKDASGPLRVVYENDKIVQISDGNKACKRKQGCI